MVGDQTLIGVLAGLVASAMWVATSLCFSKAGKLIGSTAVNTLRLIFAVTLLAVTHRVLFGMWIPDIASQQLWLLALSGLLGLTICDQALFTALVDIGPRRSLLMMTSSPIWAVGIGIVFLGETIGAIGLVGILLTVGGIAIAVLERTAPPGSPRPGERLAEPEHVGPDEGEPRWQIVRGWWLAGIAAVLQAAGMALSKGGMDAVPDIAGKVDPQPAVLVRMVFGLLGMAPVVAVVMTNVKTRPKMPKTRKAVGIGLLFTAIGAFVGPYLGVWASIIAVDKAPVGIAQTSCSLAPVMILPIAALVLKEQISKRAWLGAIVAVFGVALISLEPAIAHALTG